MSWSASGTSLDAAGIRNLPEPVFPSAEEASREQFEKVKEAAAAMVESGAVGGEGNVFNVSLGGHANEGHEKTKGWANDYVSMSINQA